MRRTVPPSTDIQHQIDLLLVDGLPVTDAEGALSQLARLGAQLIIERAVEEQFDAFIGRARYERRVDALPGKRNGWRPRHLQTTEGELEIEVPQLREAAETFTSKLFPARVAALEQSGADAVVVTPAHQFPTGAVLSAERRAALIEWAERNDRLVIEDDYDAELCRARVGALQGLAPDRVLHIGSASKRLAPGMRLGWILPPSWLSWSLISAKAIEDGGSEVAGQLALADFIARGELERHLRRMRLRYARRRETLIAALRRELPEWRPSGPGDGLYLLTELPRGTDEPALLAAAARKGVGLEGLSLHSYTGDSAPGLVVGYAHMAEPAIERGVALLAAA